MPGRTDVRGHDGKLPVDIALNTIGYNDELVAALDVRTKASPRAATPSDSTHNGNGRLSFFVQMRWNIEGRLSFDQLWDLELKEAAWAMTSGPEAMLWKVAGQKRVVGIVTVMSLDELDRIIMGRLPMREYLEFEQIWPLRNYGAFVQDVQRHYRV